MKVKKILSLALALVMVFTMIPAQLIFTNALIKSNTGDATDYSLDVSVADASAGKYNGCIDIKFNVTVDYTGLTENEKLVTMVSQMLTLDSTLVGTVSKASKTRGQLNMDAIKTAVDASDDGFVTGGADWAIVAEKIPNYDGADADEADDWTTFSFSSSSLTYKGDKVYVMLNGSVNDGYYYDEDVSSYTFTVCHLYLRTIGEVTKPQAKAGINLTTDEERIAAAIPSVFTDASYVSCKATDPAEVNSVGLHFSSDFDAPAVTYTVKFQYEDGTQFAPDQTVNEGATVSLPAIPAKDADDTYTYAVDGWYKGATKVTGDQTITTDTTFKLKYTPTYIDYTVKFVTEEGANVIEPQENLHWGDAVTVPANPTKDNHTFAGWYIGEDKVTPSETCNGTKTYVAKFTENGKYTISFIYEDGNKVCDDQELYEGAEVTIPTATKANTDEFTYTFAGWFIGDDQVTPSATAQATVTYTAKFTAVKNSYTITWLMDDDSLIDTTNVAYGEVPTHADPTKAATTDESYTFAGWTPNVVAVTGATTYKASFTATPIYADYSAVNAAKAAADEIINAPEYAYKYKDDARNALSNAINAVTPNLPKSQQENVDAMAAAIVQAKEALDQNIKSYDVVFVNDDDSAIATKQVPYGETPTIDDPTKAADAEFTYTFAGWTPALIAVSYDAASDEMVGVYYKATYTSAKRSYTITWTRDDDSVIDTTTVEYGVIPTHADATKAADAEYTYTFAGWTPEVVAVTGEATYKATFTATPIPPETTYTVIFQSADGQEIQKFEGKHIGDTITAPEAPVKQADAQYTYTFSSWKTADGTATFSGTVDGNYTYVATYTETLRSYTITWTNDDDSVIDTTTVAYGETPTHADATKAATAEYTYTFAGWTPAISAVTGEATYKATFTATKNSYTITWKNDDGSVIDTTTVEYGVVPTHADATKAATAEYTYTFAGWNTTPVAVTGDATYTATFNGTKNSYTITWKNEDGSVIDTTTVEYGVVPTHADAAKAATAEYTYTFAGWTPAVVAVTGEATYQATFTSTKNSYTVKFWNEAGTTLLDSGSFEYGTMPTTNVTPVKDATAEYTYTFAGWTPEIKAVDGEANYNATFTSAKRSYTITWKNDDGSVIDTATVEYGQTPTHADATKAATAEFTYTFAGWTPAIKAVDGDATYTATFNSTKNKYDITFKNGSEVLQTVNVEYGQQPVYTGTTPTKASTAAEDYTFKGWTVEETSGGTSIEVSYYTPDNLPAVTGEASYQAYFEASARSYTIIFKNDDGAVLDTQTVAYGETPVYSKDAPTKAATAEYTYTFDSWTPAIKAVDGDATYTATFKADKNKYDITVITKNTDGTTKTDVTAYEYGATPVLGDPATDFVVGTTKYTFTGWDKEATAVTGAATYTAQYSESTVTKPVYTVDFKYADDATQAESKAYASHTVNVEEGDTPTAPTPADFETATMKYTFAGWDKEIVPATGAATYTAKYTETPILASYNINFRYADKVAQVEDGELADHNQTVNEGSMPEIPTPADFTDGNTTYTFDGWDKEVVPATGDTVYTAIYKADTKFVPDYSELEELVERYNQMLLTGLYNKNDMKAIKALIDEIEDKIANDDFEDQDAIDAYATDLRVAEDAARLIDKQEPIDDDDDDNPSKPGKKTSPSTGDTTMVVMSIVLISAIGIAVLSLKKKRENI